MKTINDSCLNFLKCAIECFIKKKKRKRRNFKTSFSFSYINANFYNSKLSSTPDPAKSSFASIRQLINAKPEAINALKPPTQERWT